MNCPNCNKETNTNLPFCTHCGTMLGAAPTHTVVEEKHSTPVQQNKCIDKTEFCQMLNNKENFLGRPIQVSGVVDWADDDSCDTFTIIADDAAETLFRCVYSSPAENFVHSGDNVDVQGSLREFVFDTLPCVEVDEVTVKSCADGAEYSESANAETDNICAEEINIEEIQMDDISFDDINDIVIADTEEDDITVFNTTDDISTYCEEDSDTDEIYTTDLNSDDCDDICTSYEEDFEAESETKEETAPYSEPFSTPVYKAPEPPVYSQNTYVAKQEPAYKAPETPVYSQPASAPKQEPAVMQPKKVKQKSKKKPILGILVALVAVCVVGWYLFTNYGLYYINRVIPEPEGYTIAEVLASPDEYISEYITGNGTVAYLYNAKHKAIVEIIDSDTLQSITVLTNTSDVDKFYLGDRIKYTCALTSYDDTSLYCSIAYFTPLQAEYNDEFIVNADGLVYKDMLANPNAYIGHDVILFGTICGSKVNENGYSDIYIREANTGYIINVVFKHPDIYQKLPVGMGVGIEGTFHSIPRHYNAEKAEYGSDVVFSVTPSYVYCRTDNVVTESGLVEFSGYMEGNDAGITNIYYNADNDYYIYQTTNFEQLLTADTIMEFSYQSYFVDASDNSLNIENFDY